MCKTDWFSQEGKHLNMIADGLLNILLAVFGILGGSAVFWFLSQKQYHSVLWSGFSAVVLLLFIVALYIRNDLIRNEDQSNTPVYFGALIPGNERSFPLPSRVPKDTVLILLGDNLSILTAQSENYIFSKQGEKPFLSIRIEKGMMRISASIVDSSNRFVVRIIDNEFQVSLENAFNPKQPDKHSLVVRDSSGIEVLNIRFLNPKAMRIVGRFQIAGISEPVVISPERGLCLPGGGYISHLIFDMTASKRGLLQFK